MVCCVVLCCAVLCAGGAAAGLGQPVRSGPAAPCWAQPAPRAAHGSAAGKTCSERAKSCTCSQDWGEECHQQPCEHQGRRRARGGDQGSRYFPAAWEGTPQEQSSTLGPLGSTAVEQAGIPRGNYGIWRAHSPCWSKEKMWEGRSSREELLLIWTNSSPHSPSPLWERKREE